ncbi:MAG: flippase [Candidatus Magasanikbacteria bacterium]|jgi:O-antigen/teichoic acid export membrane protein|nr:flippase [Candidatus Magasanikbacteria bacterium]
MATTKQIAHNTFVQVAGKAVSTLLGFVAFLLMARYLGAEQFGWYGTTISVLGFAGILIDFGLIPVTAQMLSEPEHDKKQLFKNIFTLRLISSVLFFGAIAGLIFLPGIPYPLPIKIAICFSTLSFIAVGLNQVFVGYLQQTLKMYVQAIAEVIGRVVLIAALLMVIRHDAGFLPMMAAVVISSFAYTLVMLRRAKKDGMLGLAFDFPIWKSIMTKAWPIAIAIIFNVVYLKGDVLILSLTRTQTEVGIYTAAYRVIDILAQLAMMIMGIMLPLIAYAWSRKKTADFHTRVQQSFDIMAVIGLPITVGTLLTAHKITPLFGEELAVASVPLAILAIAVFGVYIGAVFGHTVVAIGKQKAALSIYFSNAIITLTGYLIFIPSHGITGAAWMTVFSELYAGILLYILVYRTTKKHIKMTTFAKTLLSTLIMAIPIVLLDSTSIFIVAPLAALVFAGAIIATKTISKETIREIVSKKV